MSANSMPCNEALEIVSDYASRWGENFEEQYRERVTAEMTDEQVKEMMTDHGSQKVDQWELDEAIGLRNLWRACAAANEAIAKGEVK